VLRPGAATSITFRNPFNSTVTFAMSVDRPATFHVGKAEEQVSASYGNIPVKQKLNFNKKISQIFSW